MMLKFFGYFIFIAICVIFSLVTRFPSETASKYIEQKISQTNSPVKVEINRVDPLFPPGIKADAVLVSYGGTPMVKIDNFKSLLDLSTLLSKKLAGSFKARVFDGIMSGIVRVSKQKPREIDVETAFENLNIKNFQMDKNLPDYQFSGILNGKITTGIKQGHILKNYGEVNLTDVSLQFPKSLFALETYSFSTGKIKFAMPKPNIVKIEECSMRGQQIDMQASGEIQVATNVQKSNLNIKARVILYPMFFMNVGNSMLIDVDKGDSDNVIINLRITGTIQNPKITADQGTK
jgi:type II secretion system protein N